MFFGYVFMIGMIKHGILERVSYYAYIYVILFIPELMAYFENMYKNYLNKKLKKFVSETKIVSESDESKQSVKDVADIIPKNVVKKYKQRKKLMTFCIMALIVIGTVSYNVHGLLSGDMGVHGVYPYQSWLYEMPNIFGG